MLKLRASRASSSSPVRVEPVGRIGIVGQRLGALGKAAHRAERRACDDRAQRDAEARAARDHRREDAQQSPQHAVDLVERARHQQRDAGFRRLPDEHPQMAAVDVLVGQVGAARAARHLPDAIVDGNLRGAAVGAGQRAVRAHELDHPGRATERGSLHVGRQREPAAARTPAGRRRLPGQALHASLEPRRHAQDVRRQRGALAQGVVDLAAQLAAHGEVHGHGGGRDGERDGQSRGQREPRAQGHRRRLAQHVAHAAHGLDHARLAARLELAPQVPDVDAQRVGQRAEVVVPHALVDLAAGQHLARDGA